VVNAPIRLSGIEQKIRRKRASGRQIAQVSRADERGCARHGSVFGEDWHPSQLTGLRSAGLAAGRSCNGLAGRKNAGSSHHPPGERTEGESDRGTSEHEPKDLSSHLVFRGPPRAGRRTLVRHVSLPPPAEPRHVPIEE